MAQKHRSTPRPEEIEGLLRLFGAQRYAEAASLARAMTARFPRYGFGWKASGVVLNAIGRPAEALAAMQKAAELLPEDAEVHSNLGNTLRDLGRQADAEASYRSALRIEPRYAEAHCNLGNTLRDLGRLDESQAAYRRALEIKPDLIEAHHNLGNVLWDLGRPQEAEASFRRALEINPHYALAHSSLGNLLREMGRLREAEASCRKALDILPDLAEAHNNLANVFRDLGRLQEAQASYRSALVAKPDLAVAHNNLALLLIAQGMPEAALKAISRSLAIQETSEAKGLFVDCLKRLHVAQNHEVIRAALVRALSEPWGRPSELGRIGAELVKLNPDTGACVARAARAWPGRLSAPELFGSHGLAALGSDRLLCALLDATPICDIEMERFLTMARHSLIEAATDSSAPGAESGPALRFFSALARHCFINEYVFFCGEDEYRKASDLRDSLAAALEARSPVPALWPVAVAAYFPLCSLPHTDRLINAAWPEEVATLLVQQIREPEEERQMQASIPRLTRIEDDVSLQVRRQYEENPYPRWVRTAPAARASNVVAYLSQKFPLASLVRSSEHDSVDFLIAGCGTGQHAIDTAQRFKGARILAVDLSLRSVCYAKRKTRELGLSSIEYAQADLLELGSLDRKFDVIEAVGVLHHLADPLAGWRVLLSLLRPRGFMRLGFYSELARRNIVRIRDRIAQQGYGTTADEIRRCRQDLMRGEASTDPGTILKSLDFFSVSACRDLLFHVQETGMALPGIAAFLRQNDLRLLGFDLDAEVLQAYRRRFPADPAAVDADNWNIFENECPDTFVSMYQFWIQKPG